MSAGLLELKFQHIAYLDDVKVKLFRLCVHGVVYPALPTDRNHAELSQKTRLESRCTRGALSNCSLRTSSPSLIPPSEFYCQMKSFGRFGVEVFCVLTRRHPKTWIDLTFE